MGGLIRCNPVFRETGPCVGRQKTDNRRDTGDCQGCRTKKLAESDARIKDGRARLAAYGSVWTERLEALQKDFE